MKTTTSTRPDPSSLSLKEAQAVFAGQLDSLDPQRAEGLAGLTRARTAKAAMLARDQRRATQKYGADDPRVAALTAQQAINKKLRAEVAYRAALAGIPIPPVNIDGYTFHGNVLDAQRTPQAGLTVALYDPNGAWIRQLGFACTDAQGYFRLDYQQPPSPTPTPTPTPAPAPKSSAAPPKASSAPTPPPSPIDTKGGATQPFTLAPDLSAEIRIFDKQQKLLYRSPDPLHPRLGAVDYRLIILNHEGTCAPPPESKTNIPPTRSTNR